MTFGGAWVVAMFLAQSQEPLPDPPPPVIDLDRQETPDLPVPKVEEPGLFNTPPEFPPGAGLTLRVYALRPKFSLETREFDIGSFSGPMEMQSTGGLPRTAPGLELRYDGGPLRLSMFGLHQQARRVFDEETTFEQHVFAAGTPVVTSAFFFCGEGYWKFWIEGSPEAPVELAVLAGIQVPKFHIQMEDETRTASEGFSALWPVPAVGLEVRLQLSSRWSVRASGRGTHIRYENPFQIDGGAAQKVTYISFMGEAELNWDLSPGFSVAAGLSTLDVLVENSGVEDTDTGRLEAQGIHASVTVRF